MDFRFDHSPTDKVNRFHTFFERTNQTTSDPEPFDDNGADGGLQHRSPWGNADAAQCATDAQEVACMGKCFRIASCHNYSVCPESSDFMYTLHRVGRFEVDELDSTKSENEVTLIASVYSDNQRAVGFCVLN